MMKTILSVLLLSTITLFSCQPGVEDVDPPQPDENDSIYISQMVEVDTMYETGLDTSQNTIYKYDASRRISHIWFGEYYRGKAGAELTTDYYFFYNGSDTLPHKMVHLSGTRNNTTVLTIYRYDTSYLFYNSTGLIIKDSTVSADEDHVHERTTVSVYTKIADGHYRMDEKVVTVNGVFTGYTKSHFVTVNGNMTSSRDTIFSADPGNDVVAEETATYDNHPNPLLRAALPYPTSTSYNGIVGEKSFNNQLRWEGTYDYGGLGDHWLEIYEYKYRADGYPILRLSKDEVEPSIVRHYIYTKL